MTWFNIEGLCMYAALYVLINKKPNIHNRLPTQVKYYLGASCEYVLHWAASLISTCPLSDQRENRLTVTKTARTGTHTSPGDGAMYYRSYSITSLG